MEDESMNKEQEIESIVEPIDTSHETEPESRD
jgi:hypothetical protein